MKGVVSTTGKWCHVSPACQEVTPSHPGHSNVWRQVCPLQGLGYPPEEPQVEQGQMAEEDAQGSHRPAWPD